MFQIINAKIEHHDQYQLYISTKHVCRWSYIYIYIKYYCETVYSYFVYNDSPLHATLISSPWSQKLVYPQRP